MLTCSTCSSTYSSRLDSRQADGKEGEIEGRDVKDRDQVQAPGVKKKAACFNHKLDKFLFFFSDTAHVCVCVCV